MGERLEPVAFDVEATGVRSEDELTVIGFDFPMGSRVFVQTPDGLREALQQRVRDRVGSRVIVSAHSCEKALMSAAVDYIQAHLDGDDLLLVGYASEHRKADLGLPFFRTRLSKANMGWPFRDLPFADILPLIEDCFHTLGDKGESRSDLVSAYELLGSGQLGELDPFEDDEEAMRAFEEGRYEDLAVHNIANIRRTRELSRLAQRYCSESEYRLKSLTPTIHE